MKPFTPAEASWLVEAAQQKFNDTADILLEFKVLRTWLFNQYPSWDTDEYRESVTEHLKPWYDAHPRVVRKRAEDATRPARYQPLLIDEA